MDNATSRYVGSDYDPDRPLSEVADLIRAAANDGTLPAGWRVAVTARSSSRVTPMIYVVAFSPLPLYAADPTGGPESAVWNHETGDWVTDHDDRYTSTVRTVAATLDNIVRRYNYDQSSAADATPEIGFYSVIRFVTRHGVPVYHPAFHPTPLPADRPHLALVPGGAR